MIEIRSVAGDEFVDLVYPMLQYAFLNSPRDGGPDDQTLRGHYRSRQFSTTLVLLEDGVPRATAGAHRMTQNVRGEVVEMAGIGAVATDPAARRRGYVRTLMNQLLTEAATQYAATTCLYAFRESFYGRFGYVGLPLMKEAAVETAALGPLLDRAAPPGTVEVVSDDEGRALLPDLLHRVQRDVHGMSVPRWAARPPWVDRRWYAVARDETGTVTGGLPYRLDLDKGELRGGEMVADSPAARYQLLHWIARHVDHVKVARLPLPAGTFPETWLADLRVSYKEFQSVSAMARVLSVPGLQGITAGNAHVVVRVRDPLIENNDRVWTLRGEGGALRVAMGGEPECDLTIDGLSALVFGGYDPTDLAFRGWGDPTDDVRARLRTLFPPAAAHLYAHF